MRGSSASISLDEHIINGLSVYPNPTNGPVSISFDSRSTEIGMINIYNVLGQRVNTFSHKIFAGENSAKWNLDSSSGDIVPNGTYLVEVIVNGERSIQRVAVSL